MLKQGWRWFGPHDPVSLDHVRQAGARHIVTALHEVPIGEAWTVKAVADRKNLIETSPQGRVPLHWSVVESIPIPDDVRRLGKKAKTSIEAWIESMKALATNDIKIICYNFMPVVDWTRTHLDWPLPTGATALRFDHVAFAAFELFYLNRAGAFTEYDATTQTKAKAYYNENGDAALEAICKVVTSALPGSTVEALGLEAFRERLALYKDIDATKLRQHLIEFLEIVAPEADKLGIKLTIHPDDPPRPILGLPRVVSTEADLAALFAAVPNRANGLCFCTGSLGVRPDNNLIQIAERFKERIYFTHLRATKRDGLDFYEADHLEGDVDMVGVLRVLLQENTRRSEAEKIVLRPDHGHRMLDDLGKTRITPGYTGIGRLKGLAELRGIMLALGADLG